MVQQIEYRMSLARELLQAARDEFAQAEEAKGRLVLIGLRNACGKGWLATLEATTATSWYRKFQRNNCPTMTGAESTLWDAT